MIEKPIEQSAHLIIGIKNGGSMTQTFYLCSCSFLPRNLKETHSWEYYCLNQSVNHLLRESTIIELDRASKMNKGIVMLVVQLYEQRQK